MKVQNIYLTNNENSRMKAVAEILLSNGNIIEDIRVIESDGVITINIMNEHDSMLTNDEIKHIEELTIKAYKELIKNN